jgi:parallel beta-helix repeat protein
MLLEGAGIIAQKNTIHDTQRGGIICASCIDTTIESNTVTRATTTGISITGQRITVRENLVSATAPADDGHADGMRFFGNGHRIISNRIQDISGSGSQISSHSDCFHTFDTAHPATFDVVILGNACENADDNCLVATGDERGNSDALAGFRSITFLGNTCDANGAQAVTVRHWPHADVRKNRLLGPHLKRGVVITQGSTGCTAKDNITATGVPSVEIDESSRPGFNNPF